MLAELAFVICVVFCILWNYLQPDILRSFGYIFFVSMVMSHSVITRDFDAGDLPVYEALMHKFTGIAGSYSLENWSDIKELRYWNIYDLSTWFLIIREPVFWIPNLIFYGIFGSFTGYIMALDFITSSILYGGLTLVLQSRLFLTLKISVPSLALLIWVSGPFAELHSSTIRQSLALSICFVALGLFLNRKYLKGNMALISGVLVHNPAFLLAPFILFLTKHFDKKFYSIIGFTALTFFLFIESIGGSVFNRESDIEIGRFYIMRDLTIFAMVLALTWTFDPKWKFLELRQFYYSQTLVFLILLFLSVVVSSLDLNRVFMYYFVFFTPFYFLFVAKVFSNGKRVQSLAMTGYALSMSLVFTVIG